jgi:hypothetical protein
MSHAQSVTRISASKWASNTVQISWAATQEGNVSHYEIKRSSNGTSFDVIVDTRIPSTGTYNVIDSNPIMGNNYYRVRIVGRDNSVAYSTNYRVNFGAAIEARMVYPSDSRDGIIHVAMPGRMAGESITVLNITGQVVPAPIDKAGDKRTINLQGAPAGDYIIMIMDGAGERSTHRVSYHP